MLPQRLRLALWTDLALLSLDSAAAPPRPPRSKDRAQAARAGLDHLFKTTAPFTSAARLMARVVRDTRPGQQNTEEDPEGDQGALAPLHRPLTSAERLRWHVLAGLNLARLGAIFTPADRRAKHPTAELLSGLGQLAESHGRADLHALVSAEQAHRARDMSAMTAAVGALLKGAPPWLLDAEYAARAASVRALIFGLAEDLALALGRPLEALALAEQRERRAFVDQLWQLPLAGWGRAAAPVKALRQAAAAHRAVLAGQPAGGSDAALKVWLEQRSASEGKVRARLAALRGSFPRVAGLLEVGDFPREQVLGALSPGDQIVTLLDGGGPGSRAALLSMMPGTAPRLERLKLTSGALRKLTLPQAEGQLAGKLKELTRGAGRVFVDLGRLSPGLPVERMLRGQAVVRLATLWELADAHPLRTPVSPGGVVVDPREQRATGFAADLKLSALSGKSLTTGALDLPLERAGAVVWSGPLRHDGGSPANLRLLLTDAAGRRLDDLRLPRALGLPLRGHLLALMLPIDGAPLAGRAERVAFFRMAHAMGVPSAALFHGGARPGSRGASLLRELTAGARDQDLARTATSSRWAPGTAQVYGHPGLGLKEADQLARRELKPTVVAGIGAFRKKRYGQAVPRLERALQLIEHLKVDKYLDGSLLFLANSYTFLKDLRRAVPQMERLLALRTRKVKEAKEAAGGGKAGKAARIKLLKAQAKQIKALMPMGWLRLRNEQYDEALATNRQAIELYKEVGRPALALGAYQQRAIIADKKGDFEQALANARRALEITRSNLKKTDKAREKAKGKAKGKARIAKMAKKMVAARLKVAAAALEVARLERTRFARFTRATEAVALALKELDQLSAGATKAAAPRRLASLIEACRIQGARGNYGRAVEQARQARSLARENKIQGEGTALLEEVNNLYYLGALARSLEATDQGLRLAGKASLLRLRFLNARGSALAAMGRTDAALQALNEALSIARALGNEVEVAASHNNIGNALRLGGRHTEARDQFRAALAIDRRRGDRQGMAVDRANLGLAELQLGRRKSARQELTRAANLGRKIGAPMGELKALAGLARLDQGEARHVAALKHTRRGLALSGQRGLPNWRWRFHLLAARSLRARGRVEEARQELGRGITLVQHRPPRPGRAPGAPEVEEVEEDLYHELVDLLAGSGQADAALQVSESLRARALVDLVGDGAARLPLEKAQVLARKVADLQGELAAARAAMMRRTASAKQPDKAPEAAAAQVGRMERALARVEQELATLNPWFPGMVLARRPTLPRLKQALTRLGQKQVAYYHPTRRRLVIWLLDRRGVVAMKVVAVTRARLRKEVGRHRQAVVAFHDARASARQLHRWLLAPLARHLKGDRLLIAAADALHLVPFSALHDGQDHEVARRAISYVSSIATLGRLDARDAPAGPRVSFAWTGDGPRPLAFTAREGEALARAHPGARLITGAEATAARFKQEALTARLLHVATHATLDAQAPLRSALNFHGGPLPLLEVLGLRLPASLVLLSACETGRGTLDSAGSVVGLHRAFLAAGARRVVSSLFRVSDLGSALLMKHFFRQLHRHPPARALRQARLHMRGRYPHPAFWAGFRLDGAP